MNRTAISRRLSLPLVGALALLLIALSPAPAAADAACEEQCGITYWECSDACGAFGGALCEQNCTNAYNSCIAYCATCPSIRDYSTTQVNSTTFNGFGICYKNSTTSDATGYVYNQHTSHQTISNWRETTQCNGSKSTQLLSTTNANVICWLRGGGTCSPFSNASLYICP